MDFLNLAKERYSCRSYLDKKVEKEKLEKILEAGRVAPTACNNQPQRILVLQNENTLEKLKEGVNVYNAPLVLIVCCDKTQSWERVFDKKTSTYIDASIVTDHMMLEATSLGLNSVWICYFNPNIIRKILNIPDNFEIINILALGYGNDEKLSSERHSLTRKPLEKTTFYEKF